MVEQKGDAAAVVRQPLGVAQDARAGRGDLFDLVENLVLEQPRGALDGAEQARRGDDAAGGDGGGLERQRPVFVDDPLDSALELRALFGLPHRSPQIERPFQLLAVQHRPSSPRL